MLRPTSRSSWIPSLSSKALRKKIYVLVAPSGRSADRVARSGSGRKADMPNQRVECPLMTQSGQPRKLTGRGPPGSFKAHGLNDCA
jgi:hypothetical protein